MRHMDVAEVLVARVLLAGRYLLMGCRRSVGCVWRCVRGERPSGSRAVLVRRGRRLASCVRELCAPACRHHLGSFRADRPVGSVSAAVGPRGIPWHDRVWTVRRLSSYIRIDERQPAERTLNEQFVRILRGDEERALTRTAHDGLLVHAGPSGIARA